MCSDGSKPPFAPLAAFCLHMLLNEQAMWDAQLAMWSGSGGRGPLTRAGCLGICCFFVAHGTKILKSAQTRLSKGKQERCTPSPIQKLSRDTEGISAAQSWLKRQKCEYALFIFFHFHDILFILLSFEFISKLTVTTVAARWNVLAF